MTTIVTANREIMSASIGKSLKNWVKKLRIQE
jgi:hypothetical protein